MIIKICKYCGLRKHHFAKGLCENCYYKKYRELNIERIKAKDQKYYEKNKQRHKDYMKIYNEKHKDEIKTCKRKWYQDNREKILAKGKEYRDRNKERIRELNRDYWQRPEVKIRGRFKKRLGRYGRDFARNAIKIRDLANHRCMRCGLEDNGKVFNTHHIIPFSLIRNSELWNLEYLCKACHIQRERYFRNLVKKFNILIPFFVRILQNRSNEIPSNNKKLTRWAR